MEAVTSTWCQSINIFSNVTLSTAQPLKQPDQKNALLYIVIVLLVYACSIVILMVKYIRRERVEAEYANYYYEYVSRDKFQEPRYQNLQQISRVMKTVASNPEGTKSPDVAINLIANGCESSPNDLSLQITTEKSKLEI